MSVLSSRPENQAKKEKFVKCPRVCPGGGMGGFGIDRYINTMDLSRTQEMTSLRRVLDFTYVHPIVLWGTYKDQ